MGSPKTTRYVALLIGLVFAALTLGLEEVPEKFVVLLIPGLIASMAVAGNVHAFPLWPAAIVNGIFYVALILAGAALVTKALTRTKN